MNTFDEARAAFGAWERARGDNFFEADDFFRAVLTDHLGEGRFDAERAGLSAFGAEAAGLIDRLARETNRDEHLPRLRRWDDQGRRTEQVVFHPGYDEIGERVYRTGIIGRYATPGDELVQLAYAYLLCHSGEAGHMCPVACTAGLVKILQRNADAALQARLLPGLLRTDRGHPEHLHGAQWLTEVQGGSDVGANACVARQTDDGWRVWGEKWFCSVADADVFLVTARPEGAKPGTAGLATFAMPRVCPDGSTNRFYLRRLKYKLGTRSMASGEVDLDGALAWPIGPLEGGFRDTVDIVLNTSRLHNAVAACGSMRRAQLDAATFAAHREAFGQPIARFPLVARSLARMRAETRGAVVSTFDLVATADAMARGEASADDEAFFRVGVCMNKYWTSVRCTAVVHEGIEVLGGNGTIEDFSVLPRLYRDAIVMESWEGTHNVLCAQVLRDMARYALHRPFFDRVRAVAAQGHPDLRAALDARLDAELAAAEALAGASADDAQTGVRDLVDRMMVTWQAASLSRIATRATTDAVSDAEQLLGSRPAP